jgi:AcrR family transcriptional regulator
MTTDTAGRSKPEVRARVLAAALAMAEELGPDRVRVQDIAVRAGMSSGHVLYYFGDRERILLDTLLMTEAQLAERRTRAVQRATGVDDAVDRVCRLYLPTGHRDVHWTLWAQTVARPPTDGATRAALRRGVDEWSECLALIMSRGIDEGLCGGFEPRPTAERLCRYMDGLALEVLVGSPGRSRSWAVGEAAAAWRFLSRR